MAEWARLAATTIKDYIKGYEEETLRNRKLLARLKQDGRIKYNRSGDGMQWVVRYRMADMEVNNGEQMITIDRQDRFKTANLDFEGYVIKDAMTKREKLKNRGAQAIVKYFDLMIQMLTSDMTEQFSEEIYVDSSATGNTGRMSGIETMMAVTGTLDLSVTGHATRSANAVDVVGWPDDTYAGLDTDLGAYGGSWNTAVASGTSVPRAVATHWPAGKGDPEFDFYSPIVCNYTSSSFNGSTDTWAEQCVEATRFALTHSRRNAESRGGVDLVLIDRDLYRQFCQKYDSKENLYVQRGTNSKGLYSLGFADYQMFDGAEITSEYGITAEVGYGFNLANMEFCSLQDKIFVSEGPDYEMTTRSWRVVVDCLGQFRFQSPRHFFKLASLA